jgi:hypothetical protein
MFTGNAGHVDLSPPGLCMRHLSLNGLPTGQDTRNGRATPDVLPRHAFEVTALHVTQNPGAGFSNGDWASGASQGPPPGSGSAATTGSALTHQALREHDRRGRNIDQSQAVNGSAGNLTTRANGSPSPSNPASGASGASYATAKRGSCSSPSTPGHLPSPMGHEARVRIRDHENSRTPPAPALYPRSIANHDGGVGDIDFKDIGTHFGQVDDVVVEDTEWSCSCTGSSVAPVATDLFSDQHQHHTINGDDV